MIFDELEPTGDDTSTGAGDMGGDQDDTTEAAPEEEATPSEGEGEGQA